MPHVVARRRIFCLRIAECNGPKIVRVPIARQHLLNIHKFRVYQLEGTYIWDVIALYLIYIHLLSA